MKLRGKVALVTGTSPNIGGGLVECLAEEGAAIIAVDHSRDNAVDCANAVNAMGGRAVAIECDVTDEDQARAAVIAGVAEFGHVDILVNNAAIFNKKGVLDATLAEWSLQCRIILDGAFLFTKYVAQDLIRQDRRGVVVNIVSTAGHQGEPGNIAYSTCKAGMLNFTRSAAMELARHKIRVVSLTPTATHPDEGFKRARQWGRDEPVPPGMDDLIEKFSSRIPMQSLPRPSDYGKALVFLASDDAAFVNGSDLRVDAGAVARYWAWDPSKDA